MVTHKLTRTVWRRTPTGGAELATSNPAYELWKGDKVLAAGADCIVVVTDLLKQEDRMFVRQADRDRWLTMSGGPMGPMDAYNMATHVGKPVINRAVATLNGLNPNHNLVIMLNLGGGTPAQLRLRVQRAINRAMNLPTRPRPARAATATRPARPADPPWHRRPQHITIDLIGMPPLGWTYAVAANNVIQAIEDWFAVPSQTDARHRRLKKIKLMIPDLYKARTARPPLHPANTGIPALIKAAWIGALNAQPNLTFAPNS